MQSDTNEQAPRVEAIWRVVQEADRTWTITDDLRPGFVTTGEFLQDAVNDLMTVMALWDNANEDLSASMTVHPKRSIFSKE